MSRILCQFSCGAASAVATKLALAQYGVRCNPVKWCTTLMKTRATTPQTT